MRKSPSSDYFERRAEEERVASEQAADARAAKSHRELAEQYSKLASDGGKPRVIGEPGGRAASQRDFRIVD